MMRSRIVAVTALLALLAACATPPEPATPPPAVVTPPPVTAPPSIESWSASLDDPHCLSGCPRSRGAHWRIVQRDLYALGNNGSTKLADWVAYIVSPALSGGPDRPRNWRADPELPEAETLEPGDYRRASNADYDRGHLAPLESVSASPHWADANLLSNITPQNANLNRGRWSRLERAERSFAARIDAEVYVIAGPLYETEMPPLPHADEEMSTPSGFWKVVALRDGRLSAFIFDNSPARQSYCEAERSLEEVEERSGLDLLPHMPQQPIASLTTELGCR